MKLVPEKKAVCARAHLKYNTALFFVNTQKKAAFTDFFQYLSKFGKICLIIVIIYICLKKCHGFAIHMSKNITYRNSCIAKFGTNCCVFHAFKSASEMFFTMLGKIVMFFVKLCL